MRAIDRELELATRALLAAEEWAEPYQLAPTQHAELIKLSAKMERLALVYFRNLSRMAPELVNWYHYSTAVFNQQRSMGIMSADNNSQNATPAPGYDINIVINHDAVAQQDQAFIKIMFDTVAVVTNTGVESMVVEHKAPPIGINSTSELIQDLTTDQLANLVGMKVIDKGLPTEHIIPNPNPKFSIDDTTRNRIANSVKTSIKLGENQPQAVKRLQKVIADADRADMIARTEAVRAYAQGRALYAQQAGLGAKHWYDSNATDICSDNTAEGWIPTAADFLSGDPNEPAHPNCKCVTRYSADRGDLEDAGVNLDEEIPDDEELADSEG